MLHALEYGLACGIVDVCKKLFNKVFLQLLASADDRLCLIGTEKLDFTSVTFYILSDQITFIYKLINVDRDKIRFKLSDFDNISGCFEFRVIGQKHKNIKSCLGQFQFMAERFAHAFIGQRQFPWKFNT